MLLQLMGVNKRREGRKQGRNKNEEWRITKIGTQRIPGMSLVFFYISWFFFSTCRKTGRVNAICNYGSLYMLSASFGY
jgi:hypothetical protein